MLSRQGVCWFVAALTLALPSVALGAEPVFEKYKVPTVDGAEIHVEVARPDDKRHGAGDPHLLAVQHAVRRRGRPEPRQRRRSYRLRAEGLRARGRRRASARATRPAAGTTAERKEQQSGVDVVNFLAKQTWSNGKVGDDRRLVRGHDREHGRRARAPTCPGLAAIVPQAAISRWYGYAYQDGVRYFAQLRGADRRGLRHAAGVRLRLRRARRRPTQPTRSRPTMLRSRAEPVRRAPSTPRRATTARPTTTQFWLERDYRKDAGTFASPSLVTHGWQDYNVKQSEGTDFYEALPQTRLRSRSSSVYQGAARRARPRRVQPAARALLRAHAEGRRERHRERAAGAGPRAAARTAPSIKLQDRGARGRRRAPRRWRSTLGRGDGALRPGAPAPARTSFTDRATTIRGGVDAEPRSPSARGSTTSRAAQGRRAPRRQRGARRARSKSTATTASSAPAARRRRRPTAARRRSLARPPEPAVPRRPEPLEAVPPGRHAVPRPDAPRAAGPDDRKGHRIGVIVAGSNVVWALPDDPGASYTLRLARRPVAAAAAAGALRGGAGRQRHCRGRLTGLDGGQQACACHEASGEEAELVAERSSDEHVDREMSSERDAGESRRAPTYTISGRRRTGTAAAAAEPWRP